MLRKVEEVCVENSVFDELKGEYDLHSTDDLVMCLDYFNGHIDRHIYLIDGVH